MLFFYLGSTEPFVKLKKNITSNQNLLRLSESYNPTDPKWSQDPWKIWIVLSRWDCKIVRSRLRFDNHDHDEICQL